MSRPGRSVRHPRVRSGAVAALLAASVLLAAAAVAVAPAPAAAQGTHVLLVVGLGGAPEYRETFHGWAVELREGLVERLGVPEGNVIWLAEDPARAPGAIRARSTREAMEASLAEIVERAGADDRVLLVLVGHGTSRAGESRFNLPGPDITAADLARTLEAFPTQTVAVVNTSPASGPFVEAISGPGRIVLTATKTAGEANETRFGGFFAEALAGDAAADLDKDGRLSLLEAFRYARAEVARSYGEDNLLLTEHAVLDDDGDGEGSEEPAADGGVGADGRLARSFWIGGWGTRAAATTASGVPEGIEDPELRSLYETKVDLERRVEGLRLRQGQMEAEAYDRELEELLVELALTNRSIRAKEGGGG